MINAVRGRPSGGLIRSMEVRTIADLDPLSEAAWRTGLTPQTITVTPEGKIHLALPGVLTGRDIESIQRSLE